MIRLILGTIIAMSAADAPADAPLALIITIGAAGVLIALAGVRALTRD
jgi:hypothetical protein